MSCFSASIKFILFAFINILVQFMNTLVWVNIVNIGKYMYIWHLKFAAYILLSRLKLAWTLSLIAKHLATGWQGLLHRHAGVWEAARFLLVAWSDRLLVDERPESSCRWNSLGHVVR